MCRTRRRLTNLLLLVVVGACRADESAPNDRATSAESRVLSDDSTTPGGTSLAERVDSAEQARVDSIVAAIRACPRDGRWHPCSVQRRLEMSGLRPVRADSAPHLPGLAEPATLWQMGGQSLRVVFFADSSAATAAMAQLDPLRAAPHGDTTVVWNARVTLFRAANVVALYLGGSDRAVERVTDALQAGPPQPD